MHDRKLHDSIVGSGAVQCIPGLFVALTVYWVYLGISLSDCCV